MCSIELHQWTQCINRKGKCIAINGYLGCNWVFLTKSGAIKWNPRTHTTQSWPFVMDYARCSHFAGVTTTQQCACPLPTSCFTQMSHFGNMINSSSSSHSLWHRIDYGNSRRGGWRGKDGEDDEREKWIGGEGEGGSRRLWGSSGY